MRWTYDIRAVVRSERTIVPLPASFRNRPRGISPAPEFYPLADLSVIQRLPWMSTPHVNSVHQEYKDAIAALEPHIKEKSPPSPPPLQESSNIPPDKVA